ncbi:single-stranded-DNA-specific exonuclease RecJ [Paenibacillus sp. BC26]|uniref:single-stranded-DNA-specific exonuclease RecJ n=1 Tax=Paenibacillus sp. BC26 TaxID=1881032 RepID=UPI0008F0DD09|nr:single-stranded-DNA-specific exonuclease RecJ [Paenibacillus sp. BC26]SFS75891.1 single-stranded-DNA-specific exonuclease [Paenibacillus sp. BC26]
MEWVENSLTYSQDELSYYSRAFSVEQLTTKLLFARGITNEELFSKYAYPSMADLHDPFLLSDMKKALVRIIRAMKNQEKIVIYGDYDVDGITSAAILYRALHFFKADVTALLPTRRDGYGLTVSAIERMVLLDPALIITVDNGSNAHEALRFAATKGIDVVVTDHHEINGPFPTCHAFVNPKRSDNQYPNPNLCGAGVAFKIAQALFQASSTLEWRIHAWYYIELAALGTIADLMPLTGENRLITKLGLSKMNLNPSPHLRVLFSLLNLSLIDSSTLSFLIAPILNSCGRISDPNEALKALISDEPQHEKLASFIELNKQRKLMTQECFQILDQTIQNRKLHHQNVIVAQGDYPEGLIGILAAKVTDKYQKPAIVITAEGKGSCRSVQNSSFSIINAISHCAESLKSYGGHQAAAGLTVELHMFDHFNAELQKAAALEPMKKPNKIYDSHLDICSFSNILFEDMLLMEPFGMMNPKPIFLNSRSADSIQYFGNKEQHAKLNINNKEALLFNRAQLLKQDGLRPSFLYSTNSYEKKNFVINELNHQLFS